MKTIYDCVDAFFMLLHTEYELTLGRKGKAVTFRISFCKKDCYHLMGLQYLKDRPELNRDRSVIFDQIYNRVIKKEQVESSNKYDLIQNRVQYLPFPEDRKDYTKNQASWTLLYKKKIDLLTSEEIILYDKLKR